VHWSAAEGRGDIRYKLVEPGCAVNSTKIRTHTIEQFSVQFSSKLLHGHAAKLYALRTAGAFRLFFRDLQHRLRRVGCQHIVTAARQVNGVFAGAATNFENSTAIGERMDRTATAAILVLLTSALRRH
jgi:hypothetical protein